MTDTRILDASIALLKGTGKKPARKPAQVQLEVWATDGTYTIASNGRIVEEGKGDAAYAKAQADTRADAIRKLGKTVIVYTY